jgi:hypothetical protein
LVSWSLLQGGYAAGDPAASRWRDRFGEETADALRASLESVAASRAGAPPPLLRAIEPSPENWRACLRPAAALPHYPVVLHRGGYPGGS